MSLARFRWFSVQSGEYTVYCVQPFTGSSLMDMVSHGTWHAEDLPLPLMMTVALFRSQLRRPPRTSGEARLVFVCHDPNS